jgi:hypothetical protein
MLLKYILLPWYFRLGANPFVLSIAWGVAQLLGLVHLEWIVYSIVNAYNFNLPHAPDAMYENETRFYRDLRHELDNDDSGNNDDGSGSDNGSGSHSKKKKSRRSTSKSKSKSQNKKKQNSRPFEAPQAYGTLYDARGHRFGVFMEDLSLRQAHFPNATSQLPLPTVRSALRQLARLHGKFWQSPRFLDEHNGGSGDLAWLPTPTKGGMCVLCRTCLDRAYGRA